jgi:tRNA A-37 threonylcarbamoyl transferase component Bud32
VNAGQDQIISALREARLLPASGAVTFAPLTGGVASDIWLVGGADRSFVVKRALEKLRVAADWQVPVKRNASEAFWLQKAAEAEPGAAPEILFHSAELGFIAMEYLEPQSHPVWKKQLAAGIVDVAFAGKVGRTLARIHAATAGKQELAGHVNDDALFRAIRLEPYFEFTAGRHPEVANALRALVGQTLSHKLALVHGDVSPKNILAGANGPVFLDAECAWYGDPAFDLAFCLNHLLLKCVWVRRAKSELIASFEALANSYLAGVDWEVQSELETRATRLLPGLLLARIDGKSPVEYLVDEPDRDFVRRFALSALARPPRALQTIADRWAHALR